MNVSASLKPNCTKQACIITSYSYKLTVINVVVAIVGERSQIRDDVIFDVGLLKINVIKLFFISLLQMLRQNKKLDEKVKNCTESFPLS